MARSEEFVTFIAVSIVAGPRAHRLGITAPIQGWGMQLTGLPVMGPVLVAGGMARLSGLVLTKASALFARNDRMVHGQSPLVVGCL
jgi:hypothetical protein